jgi:hypothetical protein
MFKGNEQLAKPDAILIKKLMEAPVWREAKWIRVSIICI